jgi:hypothetical protein
MKSDSRRLGAVLLRWVGLAYCVLVSFNNIETGYLRAGCFDQYSRYEGILWLMEGLLPHDGELNATKSETESYRLLPASSS